MIYFSSPFLMPTCDSEHGLAFMVVIAFLGNFLKEKPGRMTFFSLH